MQAKQAAQKIRTDLKRIGYTPQMVSVRSDAYSLGSAVRVCIKSPRVNPTRVESIAKRHERIRRDSTGEVLCGGNMHVTVSIAPEAEAQRARPWVAKLRRALQALDPERPSQLEDVDEGMRVGFELGRAAGQWYSLFADGQHAAHFWAAGTSDEQLADAARVCARVDALRRSR